MSHSDSNEDLPNPRDGYRVREFDSAMATEISLWLEITFEGVVQQQLSQEVWHSDTCGTSEHGERNRYKAFWEAIARYLNSGGTVCEALEALSKLDDVKTPAIVMPEGFVLMDTIQEVEQVRHIFINPDVPDPGQVIDWIEDLDVVKKTTREIIAEAEEGDEDDLENDYPPRLQLAASAESERADSQ